MRFLIVFALIGYCFAFDIQRVKRQDEVLDGSWQASINCIMGGVLNCAENNATLRPLADCFKSDQDLQRTFDEAMKEFLVCLDSNGKYPTCVSLFEDASAPARPARQASQTNVCGMSDIKTRIGYCMSKCQKVTFSSILQHPFLSCFLKNTESSRKFQLAVIKFRTCAMKHGLDHHIAEIQG